MRLAALATPSRALWHSWGLQHSRQLQATRRHGVVQAEGDRQQQQQGQGEASTSQPPAAAAGPAPPRPSVRMPPSISRTPPPAAVDEASVTVSTAGSTVAHSSCKPLSPSLDHSRPPARTPAYLPAAGPVRRAARGLALCRCCGPRQGRHTRQLRVSRAERGRPASPAAAFHSLPLV